MSRLFTKRALRLFCVGFAAAVLLLTAVGPSASDDAKKPSAAPSIQLIPVIKGYPAGQVTPLFLLLKPSGKQKLAIPREDQPLRIIIESEGITAAGGGMFAPGGDKGPLDMAILRVDVRVSKDAKAGERQVGIMLQLPSKGKKPIMAPFMLKLEVLPVGAKPVVASPEMLAKLTGKKADTSGGMVPSPKTRQAEPARDTFAGQSFWWVIVLVFLGGLALNLTPCVYPLIPITVGFFGGRAQGSKGLLLANALLYWAGLIITYTVLGAFVSLSGGMLGEALTHPFVTILIAAVLLAMALSMFGLWEIKLPASVGRLAGASRAGLFGALIMGLTVGLLAAPCVGPFVVGLMTHVARVGRMDYGLAVFFSLSVGLGLPLALMALFSGFIQRLPGAGDWMVWVRKFFGVLLILMALYVVQPLLGGELFRWALAVFGAAGGIYLGFLAKGGGKRFTIFKRLAGAALVAGAVAFLVLTAPPKTTEHISWVPFSPKVLEEAAAQGKPAVVYFTADWCTPCKQFKASTLPDPRVVEAMKNFVPVMVDVTKGAPPAAQPLIKTLQVRGVPTIAFLDRRGKPISELTVVGLMGPEDFSDRLKLALSKAGKPGKGG